PLIEDRKRMYTLTGTAGGLGDVAVALLFLILRPFDGDMDIYVAAFLLASGAGLFFIFYWFMPKRLDSSQSLAHPKDL
ncbi:MAG: hypothetical protein QXJ32_01390, partial [Thermoplasmata archaeon]